MTDQRMKNILKGWNSIILEINAYNNDLWSKYVMIVLISDIIVLDLALFETVFGKMSFFFKMLTFYISNTLLLLLMILINTASSVSLEANKSYKLLNKLFITDLVLQQIRGMNILKESNSCHLKSFLFLYFFISLTVVIID
jgi:hypothetical protein